MDIASHNEEEKGLLQSAIEAIDAGDLEGAKGIIQQVIAGEDQETAEAGEVKSPSLKEKFQKVMTEGKEKVEA